MQNERGTQHGPSRRTPLPLFRAVSIFCLSVAIFSTSLRVGSGHILPPARGLSDRTGAADKRRLPLPLWGRALGGHLTAIPEAAKRPPPEEVMAIQPLILIDPLPRTL